MVISVSLTRPPTPQTWNFRIWVMVILVSKCISYSSSSNNLTISLTFTHPTLKQWQQPLPSHYTRSKPANGTVWRSSPINPALTPHLPAACMYPVLPSLFTLCFLCVKHPPQPPPLCQTGTPTPDVRLFSDVISSVESSSPPHHVEWCHPKLLYPLAAILFISLSELTGHVLCSSQKTRKIFKGKDNLLLLYKAHITTWHDSICSCPLNNTRLNCAGILTADFLFNKH